MMTESSSCKNCGSMLTLQQGGYIECAHCLSYLKIGEQPSCELTDDVIWLKFATNDAELFKRNLIPIRYDYFAISGTNIEKIANIDQSHIAEYVTNKGRFLAKLFRSENAKVDYIGAALKQTVPVQLYNARNYKDWFIGWALALYPNDASLTAARFCNQQRLDTAQLIKRVDQLIMQYVQSNDLTHSAQNEIEDALGQQLQQEFQTKAWGMVTAFTLSQRPQNMAQQADRAAKQRAIEALQAEFEQLDKSLLLKQKMAVVNKTLSDLGTDVAMHVLANQDKMNEATTGSEIKSTMLEGEVAKNKSNVKTDVASVEINNQIVLEQKKNELEAWQQKLRFDQQKSAIHRALELERFAFDATPPAATPPAPPASNETVQTGQISLSLSATQPMYIAQICLAIKNELQQGIMASEQLQTLFVDCIRIDDVVEQVWLLWLSKVLKQSCSGACLMIRYRQSDSVNISTLNQLFNQQGCLPTLLYKNEDYQPIKNSLQQDCALQIKALYRQTVVRLSFEQQFYQQFSCQHRGSLAMDATKLEALAVHTPLEIEAGSKGVLKGERLCHTL